MSLSLMRFPKPAPFRSEKYKKWIRGWPCIVCGRHPVECAHVGPHSLGSKADDTWTVPLCHRCHRTDKESYHALSQTRFEEVHGLDLKREVIRFLTEYIRISEGEAS